MEISEKQIEDFCDNYCKYMSVLGKVQAASTAKVNKIQSVFNVVCNDCPMNRITMADRSTSTRRC